jgi:hypothetical protein
MSAAKDFLAAFERLVEGFRSPEPEPMPKPQRGAPRPRYKLTAALVEPKADPAIPPEQPPHGVEREAWLAARQNVLNGSAPSTIAKGSDVPSDFTLRIQGLMPR